MRLIDADALYIEIMDRGIDGLQMDDLSEIQQVIADAPTVDAVSVVRCGSCRYTNVSGYCEFHGMHMGKNDFCSDGEKANSVEWVFANGAYFCPSCGEQAQKETPYCPNCGAKME